MIRSTDAIPALAKAAIIKNGKTSEIATPLGNPSGIQANGIKQFRITHITVPTHTPHIRSIARTMAPYDKHTMNMPLAITKCRGPEGNPAVAAEARWPAKPTKPPTMGEIKPAAKNAGAESSATDPIVDGSFICAVTADNAEKAAAAMIDLMLMSLLSKGDRMLFAPWCLCVFQPLNENCEEDCKPANP